MLIKREPVWVKFDGQNRMSKFTVTE